MVGSKLGHIVKVRVLQEIAHLRVFPEIDFLVVYGYALQSKSPKSRVLFASSIISTRLYSAQRNRRKLVKMKKGLTIYLLCAIISPETFPSPLVDTRPRSGSPQYLCLSFTSVGTNKGAACLYGTVVRSIINMILLALQTLHSLRVTNTGM